MPAVGPLREDEFLKAMDQAQTTGRIELILTLMAMLSCVRVIIGAPVFKVPKKGRTFDNLVYTICKPGPLVSRD